MLISIFTIIQLQKYFGEARRRNISYAILYEHRVGDPMATKISTGLVSRQAQLTRLYLFGIKSSWIKSQKYIKYYIWYIIYDNSTESSDTWILRYTENKNIQLASHFGP